MGNYNFDEDLNVAKQTEHEIGLLFAEYYGWNLVSMSNHKGYDLVLEKNGRNVLVEVKEDFAVGKTGNVAVEFSCRGKPSGISTTQADFWLYRLHMNEGLIHVLLETDELKRKIELEKYFRTVNGGDEGSNSLNYLFKLEEFSNNGKFIF